MDTNSFVLGILIAISSCLAIVSSQRERCLGGYCSGQFGDMKAICKDGYCYCAGQDYDYNTCLRKFVNIGPINSISSVRSSTDPLMHFNFFHFQPMLTDVESRSILIHLLLRGRLILLSLL